MTSDLTSLPGRVSYDKDKTNPARGTSSHGARDDEIDEKYQSSYHFRLGVFKFRVRFQHGIFTWTRILPRSATTIELLPPMMCGA